MKYLNIRLNTSYGIQGHSYNILAQTVHACIRLSSHCNFISLKVTQRHYQNIMLSSKKDTLEAGNELKWNIDTLNPKNQQNMFVVKKHNYKPNITCVMCCKS